MNHATSVVGTQILTDEIPHVPGAFYVHENFIDYRCPCGCDELMALPVNIGEKKTGAWLWNGNIEQPTLHPSIRRMGGCRWHGHLQGGVWNPCGDSGQ